VTHTGPTTTRVLTQNIFALEENWPARMTVLANGLASLNPDILLLQKTIVTSDYDQASDLLDGYVTAHSSTRESNGQGITIASRWPIVDSWELDLKRVSDRTGDFACTCLIAAIDVPGPIGRLLAVNHFPDFQVDHELERERQAVISAKAIDALLREQPAHVILGGDLDAEPDSASLRFLSGKQSLEGMSVCYRSAWETLHPGGPCETFVPRNAIAPDTWPFQRIDHLFVRCGPNGHPTLVPERCDIQFDLPVDGVWASNHFGVSADFSLSPLWHGWDSGQ
jgi:endonuclease/exonuclease/phosphatase family metal-dependent hydrolase